MVPTVAIIGGGFTGAAVAVHLSRAARTPLNIAVVEPRAELGRGVAYSATDPDHRTNGPTLTHSLYVDDAGHFDRWFRANDVLAGDPECRDAVGRIFVRRADMGCYVGDEISKHQAANPSGSAIRHVRDRAIDARRTAGRFAITLAGGDELAADLMVVTTSNAPPAIPRAFADIADHPGFVADPWDLARLAQLAPDAHIFIVGTGLTMADVAVTVLRERPDARITAVSRRGLLPQSQRRVPAEEPIPVAMARELPEFIARHGRPNTVRALLSALRDDIRRDIAQGIEWQVAFDAFRDSAHHLWPELSTAEVSRFLRHLSPWYETYRFRYPPQTEIKIRAFRADGRLTTHAAAIERAEPQGEEIAVTIRRRGQDDLETDSYDAVINCTGPDRNAHRRGDAFLHNLVAAGLAQHHPLGLGLEVDLMCRAQDGDGRHNPRLRVVGPLSRGRLGETNGVPHTGYHLARILPEMVAELAQIAAAGSDSA